MAHRLQRLVVGDGRRGVAVGLVAALVGVAACTAAIFGLREIAPVLSLGVVYLVAVLVVAANWGLGLGLLTAVLSALAYNYFHIPPTGRFTIRGSENVVGLVAFLVAAALASSVSDLARTRAQEAEDRRREADLSAELTRSLLGGEPPATAVAIAARRLAQTLKLPSAAIELQAVEGDDRRVVFPLRDGARTLGTLIVPAGLDEGVLERLQRRVVPALEAVLAAALEREELQAEVVETAALRRGDAVKTALLRSVSHDLRSPLTAIATAGEGLSAAHLDDEDRRELGAVVGEEAARLTRLIDNLLDLSRLEAGAAEPRREWTSIDDVLRAAAEEAGGGFSFVVDPDLPLVRADAAQLERAFANLLDNAAHHSGGHPVSVRARAVGGRLVVRVVDRGPGIAAAQLERVFEPFFQAGGGRTGGARGSGLGLAIARGFVEANGGRLKVESLPDQGASFVCELPLEPAPTVHDGAAAPVPGAP
jgi:two-component system, OmpR family, sensor histidine kinase KdpD